MSRSKPTKYLEYEVDRLQYVERVKDREIQCLESRSDVTEAFLRLCEALGIQAAPLAYLEVPAIIRAAEMRGASQATKNNTP